MEPFHMLMILYDEEEENSVTENVVTGLVFVVN